MADRRQPTAGSDEVHLAASLDDEPRKDHPTGTTARPVGIEELLAALRRGWLVIIGFAFLAWSIAYAHAGDQMPVFQSEARLVIAPAELAETRDVIDTSAGLERESIVSTLAEVMVGTTMRDRASTDPVLDGEDLSGYSTTSAPTPLANVVTLTVRGPDAKVARRLGTVLVRESVTYFESVYPIYRVDELDAPSLETGPVAPKPQRDGVLAGFGGALVGMVVVIAVRGWQARPGPQPVDQEPRLPTAPRLVEVAVDVEPTPAKPAPRRRRSPAKRPAPSAPSAASAVGGATSSDEPPSALAAGDG